MDERTQIRNACDALNNALQQCRSIRENGRLGTREYEAWREEATRLVRDMDRFLSLSLPPFFG